MVMMACGLLPSAGFLAWHSTLWTTGMSCYKYLKQSCYQFVSKSFTGCIINFFCDFVTALHVHCVHYTPANHVLHCKKEEEQCTYEDMMQYTNKGEKHISIATSWREFSGRSGSCGPIMNEVKSKQCCLLHHDITTRCSSTLY